MFSFISKYGSPGKNVIEGEEEEHVKVFFRNILLQIK